MVVRHPRDLGGTVREGEVDGDERDAEDRELPTLQQAESLVAPRVIPGEGEGERGVVDRGRRRGLGSSEERRMIVAT